MRDCKRHPGSQSQPGGGVCASCLHERLVWLWRGESFRLDDDDPASQQPEGDDAQAPARPALGVGSDIASVRKQLQVNGVATKPDPRNNSDAPATAKKPDVIVEWAEFHAQRRRRNLELESSSSRSSSPSMAQISRSLDSLEFKRLMVDNTDRSYRSRSMPLDNRSAEETALRVIREVQQADDHLDELDFLDGGLQMLPEQQQRRIRRRSIFFWQSPKWVMKLLVMSPATSQNNKKKVFPSRVGSRKRLTRFNSSDWSHTDENWMVSTLQGISQLNTRKVDDMEKHQRRTNVLSWLQDADRRRIRKHEPTGMSSSFSSSSGSTDSCHRDLTTVGHLHEIAEELEEEDEVVPTDSLGDISSFGIYLLSAAERQPQAGLTRVSSAA